MGKRGHWGPGGAGGATEGWGLWGHHCDETVRNQFFWPLSHHSPLQA